MEKNMSKKLTLLAFVAILFGSAESYAGHALAAMTGQHACQKVAGKEFDKYKKNAAHKPQVVNKCIQDFNRADNTANKSHVQSQALSDVCLAARGYEKQDKCREQYLTQ